MKKAVCDLLAAGADPHQDICFTDLHRFPVDEAMQKRRGDCKTLVEKAKGTVLSLKNRCRNRIIGLLHSAWKARSAQTDGLENREGSGVERIKSIPESIQSFLKFEYSCPQKSESKPEFDSDE